MLRRLDIDVMLGHVGALDEIEQQDPSLADAIVCYAELCRDPDERLKFGLLGPASSRDVRAAALAAQGVDMMAEARKNVQEENSSALLSAILRQQRTKNQQDPKLAATVARMFGSVTKIEAASKPKE